MSTTCQINPVGFEKPRSGANLSDCLLQGPPNDAAQALPPATGELLKRSLAELVRYYRHSAAGRRCHGLIHNLNAPLQVLSFQVELLMQKAAEEENRWLTCRRYRLSHSSTWYLSVNTDYSRCVKKLTTSI